MRRVRPGNHVMLKYDPMYFRCGSEQNDVHFLRFHILKKGEQPECKDDIPEDSDMAGKLLGKALGEKVRIGLGDTGIDFDYEIVDIG